MIPNITLLTQEITEQTYPSHTYKLVTESNRVSGFVDDVESIKQAINLILSSERYQHIIYSWDYGVELFDLIGKPMPYVMSELQRRVKDALTQDDRIKDVVDFKFERSGKKLHAKFTVITNLGNINTGLEVDI